MFRVLHLSDIHIGRMYQQVHFQKKPTDVAHRIASDACIKLDGQPIKCIVVTGDIFDGRTLDPKGEDRNQHFESIITVAVDFFRTLLSDIKALQQNNTLTVEDVLFVPGNHDILRSDKDGHTYEVFNRFLLSFYDLESRFYYNQIDLPDFYIDPPNSFMGSGYLAKMYQWEPCFLKAYPDAKIAFLGFNSARCEICELLPADLLDKIEKGLRNAEQINEEDKSGNEEKKVNVASVMEFLRQSQLTDYDDYGEINTDHLDAVQRKTVMMDKDYNFVALFHHHFSLFPESQESQMKNSIIREYSEVLEYMKNMNVRTVLHGHKHFAAERPIILDGYRNGSGASSLNIIEVFSGGSIGACDAEIQSFSVIDFYGPKDATKIVHHRFSYRRNRFEPIQKLTIDAADITNRKLENE